MSKSEEVDEVLSCSLEKTIPHSTPSSPSSHSASESSQNATSQKAHTSPSESRTPYTTFTRRHRRLLTVILALTMLASPLTATIYLPLLPMLATQFNVSTQAINLTVTLYIVFQGISPLLFATTSDTLGRRPIYLTTYALYTAASLGLALNRHSYPVLLILRALQSLGASAVLAIAFGVVADVCPPAERGAMLGPTQGAANLAVCLGPILGGWIALGSRGTVWVFWALVIFGGSVLFVVGIALPETARNVVGNGSIEATGWWETWWDMSRRVSRGKISRPKSEVATEHGGEQEKVKMGETNRVTGRKRDKLTMMNPLACIKMIFWKDTALVLWIAASPYAVWYCVQASIPAIYKDIYRFNEFDIGLCYLTGGAGTVLGGYANGKLMDWKYKVTAKEIGHIIDKVSGDDLKHFPIERARARGSWYLLTVYVSALVGYGWSLQAHTHESVPLILQFVLAALCTSFQQTFNALLVDIFPSSPSTAAASSTITRCALSAIAVAVLQPLVDVMGRGWYFTLLTLLSGGGGIVSIWFVQTRGMRWRRQRLSKADKSKGDEDEESNARGCSKPRETSIQKATEIHEPPAF